MKHEWKKVEKNFYLPKEKPERIVVPKFKFYTIHGQGNPNEAFFAEYVGVLYALSYGIRMSTKAGAAPANYYEYTVYPLEGVWDISEEARQKALMSFDKNELVFDLMIRQPDFVSSEFVMEMIEKTNKRKPNELLDKVKFEEIEEGECIQMLHVGPYDSEPVTFGKMEVYAKSLGLVRKFHTHREIYLSDPRKTLPDKLRTVLRYHVAQS